MLNMSFDFNGLLKVHGDAFSAFKDLLLEYNRKYNLTAITDEKEIYVKHFYDSVFAGDFFPLNASVIEIGSGGGFPSVPLKIVRNDLSFTLVECTGKKCEFLRTVVDKLGLNCVKIVNIRAEDGGRIPEMREKFDVATARAVAKLNTLSEYCLPFVKVGGKFIAYKGESENIEESENAIKILGGEIESVNDYELPSDFGKRRIIVIKKVAPTPLKYPRGRGLERKKPL